ncbi:MAG: hypothetical protein M0014_04905 [Actinomycetota bacterium]|nr:hypothetical protein [Actinomycetota bacterium]
MLGGDLPAPILCSPVGGPRMLHHEGELAVARAVRHEKIFGTRAQDGHGALWGARLGRSRTLAGAPPGSPGPRAWPRQGGRGGGDVGVRPRGPCRRCPRRARAGLRAGRRRPPRWRP